MLLICYSIIKIVREPLILLGGGAEVRSYAAAGQALLLMGFVPVLQLVCLTRRSCQVAGWRFAVLHPEYRAVRARRVGATCRTSAWCSSSGSASSTCPSSPSSGPMPMTSTARRPATACSRSSSIGMTAGPPLGSFVTGRLFAAGVEPQLILQVSAALLFASLLLYLLINATGGAARAARPKPLLAHGGGFRPGLPQRLPAADRAPHRPAQRRQHHRRVPDRATPARATPARWRRRIRRSTARHLHRRVQRQLSVLGQRDGARAPGVRRLAPGQICQACAERSWHCR